MIEGGLADGLLSKSSLVVESILIKALASEGGLLNGESSILGGEGSIALMPLVDLIVMPSSSVSGLGLKGLGFKLGEAVTIPLICRLTER